MSGVASNGSSVTISGSGFGSKSPAGPILWDNFEDGVDTSATVGVWDQIGEEVREETSVVRSGSRCARAELGGSDSYGAMEKACSVGTNEKLYVYLWRRYKNPLTYEQQKALRIYKGGGDSFGLTWGYPYGLAAVELCDETKWITNPAHFPSEDVWYNETFVFQLGSGIDTHDGFYSYAKWDVGGDGGTVLSVDDANYKCAGYPGDLVTLYIEKYGRGAGDNEQYVDDVYMDTTWQRVIIGNNQTFSQCTHREIQIPTTWADGQITITVNTGSLPDGLTAYLFVVDAEGDANANGYPIVIGGTGEDTAPPTTSDHDPAKDETGVTADTNVVVHVQDSGDGVDQSSIVMTVNGGTVNPTISGTPADYTVTYNPPQDFAEGQEVAVTVDARDLHAPPNVMPQDSYTFTIALAPDTTDPLVNITQPTSGDTHSTDQNSTAVEGTASDNIGVTTVTWVNNRGGNGTATGTADWTVSNIQLQEGDNIISVTAHDAAGNTGTDTLTVDYTPPAGTYTAEFGSATGTDYPGTLQDTFININSTNYSSENLLSSYTWPQDSVSNAMVLKWDLSAIPGSATIQDATLYLYLSNMDVGGGDDPYDLGVHRIINYNPVIPACTGYTYDGTHSWTPNNQCYNNIPLAQADIDPAESTQPVDKTYGYKLWGVTNMVQDWVSDPASNYGMLVNSDPIASSDSNRYFSSTEASNPDQRPKLVVNYTVGEPPDTTDPTVAISSPTSQGTYSTELDTVDLGGSASDNVGVTSVTWTNSRGGSGTASGTESWTIPGISLHCGDDNVLTVTAEDDAGNSATDTLTVDVKPCTPLGFDTQ
ncbi:MAG: DNRLRE domain-containing protein [Thermodesulfobacteriota bacterium]|nr:DNRLRE domain-containing protein [Thermodesulfobacteriota bacterium]